jgi:hypothetical protein
MAKKKEQDRILALCHSVAKVVHKEVNGRHSPHHECLMARLQVVGAMDIGEDLIEDIAAIVEIGIETKGELADEMLETLEEKLSALLRLTGIVKSVR